jgi:sec-independent protein translocase protein TatC
MPGFDIGHLIVILTVALLVIGPARLPQIARRISQFVAEAQKANVEFAKAFQEGLRESEVAGEMAAAESTTWRDLLFHFKELRDRLVISIVAVLVLTTVAYIFSDVILRVLRAPAGEIKLYAFSPMDGFLIRFRVALYGGLFLAAPIWIYELWRYIEPALHPNEKRFLLPGVVGMVILFVLGNVFGYLMLTNMVGVLFAMFGSELNYFPSADQFISFVVFFLLATGLAFELPIVILALMKIGLLSPQSLRKQRRIVYFLIFVFAELITPVSDPIVAPTVVMLPMVVLFELALFFARFIVPKPAPSATAAAASSISK